MSYSRFQRSALFFNLLMMISLLPAGFCSADTLMVKKGSLGVVFGDNDSGQNGIRVLQHVQTRINAYKSDGAGNNLEFIFTGDDATYGWDIFAPRNDPMTLTRVNDTTVQLRQDSAGHWPLRTVQTIKVVPPHYLDFTIEATLHGDISEFNKYNYVGIFYAAYMNTLNVAEKPIYFIGQDTAGLTPVGMVRSYTDLPPGNQRVITYYKDGYVMKSDPDNPIRMTDSHSGYEFIYPFYYGKLNNMAYIIMFEEYGHLRFARSPTGTGSGNPAWDFFYVIPAMKQDTPYVFSGRIAYKPFVDSLDVIHEYESWSGMPVSVSGPRYPAKQDMSGLDITPNPFKTSTSIRIGYDGAEKITAKIYDLKGKVVADLSSAFRFHPTVNWDAKHMASGIYLLNCRIHDKQFIKTIFLLK